MKCFMGSWPVVLALLILSRAGAWARDGNTGLIDEHMLHPLDSFTGDTFRKGEWFYAQPPVLLPGWALWGLTDGVTVELDFTAWVIGVPDMNVRVRLWERGPLRLASETMAFYISAKIGDLDGDDEHLLYERPGIGGYSRLNVSWNLSGRVALHLSGGGSYSRSLTIANEGRPESLSRSFNDYVEPVASVGFDVRLFPWLSLNAAGSYGETFVYFENHPRKYQATYGFRLAPFYNNKYAFLKHVRIELAGIYTSFPDIRETRSTYAPIYPYIYWQW